MHQSIARTLLWGYWANIVYIIGMIGYLIIDTISYAYVSLNAIFSFVVYILLAFIFVIDAVLYTVDWYMYAVKLRKGKDQPIQYRFEFFACIFQNLGSIAYLMGAILAFDNIFIVKRFFVYIVGTILFSIESILTLLGWVIQFQRSPKNNCSIKNIHMWAHVLNCFGNFFYLCAAILAYYFYKTQHLMNATSVHILQILGDVIYLLDAYFYYKCWHLDKQAFDFVTEEQNLNELSLTKYDHQNKINNENKLSDPIISQSK